MPVQLVAKTGFSAFGKDYPVGTVVPKEDADAWPPNTLATRMNNGYVEYSDVPEGQDVAGEETDYEQIQRNDMMQAAEDDKQDIGKMNEADLKAYVDLHGLTVDLDKVSGISAKRKAVSDALSAKQAAMPIGGQAGAVAKPVAAAVPAQAAVKAG